MKQQDGQANYTCTEYREEMILLSLRMRLAKTESEAEREKIRFEIKKLEAAMRMD